MSGCTCVVRRLGLVEYAATAEAMRAFTERRHATTPDEIWLLEHPPVYTLGLKANARCLDLGNGIPVVPTDRGGDVTYHGPGQAVAYALIDLQRRGLGIKALVRLLEQSVIDLLAERSITADRRDGAPGVYVSGRKIAALGLRVRRGCTYHGLSFNIAMDLAPFRAIDPCGYPGLEVTQLSDLAPGTEFTSAAEALLQRLLGGLGYTEPLIVQPAASNRTHRG